MDKSNGITADAIALQERDEFRADGWLKVIAPAKVNLHLAIGSRRSDGYHNAVSIMHALALRDVVYLRRRDEATDAAPHVVMAGAEACDVAPKDNLASKAVSALARICGRPASDEAVDIRIEKNIPMQAGLGGGSSDAAAALVGTAKLWGLAPDDDRIEQAARGLGADVAFFLHGGCGVYRGTGDVFARSLRPSRQAVALVKPAGGVSTAEAYRAFDAAPKHVPAEVARQAETVERADELPLYNNLAPASESIMPELASVRSWLERQPGSDGVLLCGSGAATFAVCHDFASALRMVAAARARGWWARATSFSPLRTCLIGAQEGVHP